MKQEKIKNSFVYLKAKKECEGKSLDWLQRCVNELISDLKTQIEKTGRAPESEQLDRIESVMQAIKEEIEKQKGNIK